MSEGKSTETVDARWVDGQVFLLRGRNAFPIVLSQPDGARGADLLPLSLIGCPAWDVVAILRKQRQSITGFEVSARSVREEEAPWRFQQIHVHYRIRGKDLDRDRISRAIELAENKYCSIYATLRKAVDLRSDFELESE